MRVAILGAGQMGTAFGASVLERDHEVYFWGPDWIDGPCLEAISAGKSHPDLDAPLPSIPTGTTTELEEAVKDAEVCVIAVISEGAEWVAEKAAEATSPDVPVLVLTKGFAERGGEIVPVTTVVQEAFGEGRDVIGVGGPVKASELIRKLPTHTVFASEFRDRAQEIATAVETDYYLPTTTEDLTGTALCSALKNCYAIAVNLLAGEDGPSNLRALAFSAALKEMYTFVVAAGGKPETVSGAAGSGDLYVTCLTGRNGDFGRLLSEGHSTEESISMMNNATVEGLGALGPALKLAESLGIEDRQLPLLQYLDEVLRTGREEGESPPLAEIVSKDVSIR